MTREEKLVFLNREIERLNGVDIALQNAKTQYEKECLQGCVDVLNKYITLRDELI